MEEGAREKPCIVIDHSDHVLFWMEIWSVHNHKARSKVHGRILILMNYNLGSGLKFCFKHTRIGSWLWGVGVLVGFKVSARLQQISNIE